MAKPTDAAENTAQPAISADTVRIPLDAKHIAERFQHINPAIRPSDVLGYAPTDAGSEPTFPSLENSEPPSKTSKQRWQAPRSAKEFAIQANRVATMVLNSEIDLDTARTYSAVARTAAQMLSAEVQRARFLQSEPDLRLEEEDG